MNKKSRPRCARPESGRKENVFMTSVTQPSRKRKYTLDEIKAMDRDMITPAIASGVVGCDPYYITVQAKEDPAALGFPVCVVGTRTKIPRLAFIRWVEGT